ncbi:unnamed protein product [Hanseniaspora opuntiae]
MDIRLHLATKFISYLETLRNEHTQGSLYVVISELIYETSYSKDYLALSIVPKRAVDQEMEKKLAKDGYYITGQVNTTSMKFEYESAIKIITYETPKLPNMQFYSHTSINKKLFDTLPESDKKLSGNLSLLIENMDSGSDNHYYQLDKVIHSLNISDYHLKLFNNRYESLVSIKPKDSLKENYFLKPFFKLLNIYLIPWVFILIQILFKEIIFNILKPIYSLRYYSVLFLQLDLRIKQFAYFPVQYLSIGERSSLTTFSNNEKLYTSYMDYIRYYNTLWLIVNDYSFSLTVSALLKIHKEKIAKFLMSYLNQIFIKNVYQLTGALSQNPFGIKLNDELTKFLRDLFVWIIDFVDNAYFKFLTNETTLMYIIDALYILTYCFGVTFFIAFLIDYLTVLTLHFKIFYKISYKLYRIQLKLLISLVYLFCGKKYNTLRNRIDNESYSLEVLLVGVLIFMILIFLMPTTIAFYLIYTFLQYIAKCLEIVLMTIIMCFNHFPLFIMMLKLKDQKRIPNEIQLSTGYETIIQSPVIKLSSESLRWKDIFTNFWNIITQFQNEIISVNLISKMILGKDILIDKFALYKPLYSTVPKNHLRFKDLVCKLLRENPRKYP